MGAGDSRAAEDTLRRKKDTVGGSADDLHAAPPGVTELNGGGDGRGGSNRPRSMEEEEEEDDDDDGFDLTALDALLNEDVDPLVEAYRHRLGAAGEEEEEEDEDDGRGASWASDAPMLVGSVAAMGPAAALAVTFDEFSHAAAGDDVHADGAGGEAKAAGGGEGKRRGRGGESRRRRRRKATSAAVVSPPPRETLAHEPEADRPVSAVSEKLAELQRLRAELAAAAELKRAQEQARINDVLDFGKEMEMKAAREAHEKSRLAELSAMMDAAEDAEHWLDQAARANFPPASWRREGWLLGAGPEDAHISAAEAGTAPRHPPALVAWLTPPDDDDALRADPEARALRASKPSDAFAHESAWADDYYAALSATQTSRKSGEAIPGGTHGAVAINLLSRRLQLMAILSGGCSIVLPAYAYAAVYRKYSRLWAVSFSGLFVSLALALLGLFAAESRSPWKLTAYSAACPTVSIAQALYATAVAAQVDLSCRQKQSAVVACSACSCAFNSTCADKREFGMMGCPDCLAWDATVCKAFSDHLASWGVLSSLVSLLVSVIPAAVAVVLLMRLENAKGLAKSQSDWIASQLRAQCRRLRAGKDPYFHGALAAQSAALFRRLAAAAATHNPRLAAFAEALLGAWEREGREGAKKHGRPQPPFKYKSSAAGAEGRVKTVTEVKAEIEARKDELAREDELGAVVPMLAAKTKEEVLAMKAEEQAREQAAVAIQAGFRGWQARKAVGIRRASDKIMKDLVAGRLTGLIVMTCGIAMLVVGGLAFLKYYAELI